MPALLKSALARPCWRAEAYRGSGREATSTRLAGATPARTREMLASAAGQRVPCCRGIPAGTSASTTRDAGWRAATGLEFGGPQLRAAKLQAGRTHRGHGGALPFLLCDASGLGPSSHCSIGQGDAGIARTEPGEVRGCPSQDPTAPGLHCHCETEARPVIVRRPVADADQASAVGRPAPDGSHARTPPGPNDVPAPRVGDDQPMLRG